MLFHLINYKIFILVILGGFLPSILWLWFWLKEDKKNPEPKYLILTTFLAGGLSVFAAFYLETKTTINFDFSTLENIKINFNPLLAGIKTSIPLIAIFFVWAFIEELVKYLAVALTSFRNKNFNEPVDAVIYMITAALGFTAIENSFFLIKTLSLNNGFDFLLNGNLRFICATMLHVFSSAIVGVVIGLSFKITGWRKVIRIIFGLLIATLLHALFNFFIIINGGQNVFKVMIVLWLSTIIILILFEKIKKIKINYVQR